MTTPRTRLIPRRCAPDPVPEAPPPAEPVRVFNFRDEPIQLEAREWRPGIKARERRGACAHQWGVEVGTTSENRNRYGELEALARRAIGTPYHVSAGVTRRAEPFVAVCHPAERYTHHADAGNRGYIGLGVMGLFPEVEARRAARHYPDLGPAGPPLLRAAMRAAIAQALVVCGEILAELGGTGPWELVTHRQTMNEATDDREADPGEWIVEALLTSSAVARGLFIPEPDLVLVDGCGKPWPPEWRAALGRTSRRPPLAVVVDDAPPAVGGPAEPPTDDGGMSPRFG